MRYPGGKGGAGVFQTIINQFPPHRVYIEPFVGGGNVFERKAPAAQSILADRDAEVVEKWRACSLGRTDVAVRQTDALDLLSSFPWVGDELVYLDPPYVHSTRRDRALYRYAMSDSDHARLLFIAKGIKAAVAISGYRCALYDQALADWRRIDFQAMTRRGPATESLWMNYPAPARLADYGYAGQDFRERERIKRKAARFVAKWDRLPELERGAIVQAMGARWGAAAPAGTGEARGPLETAMRSAGDIGADGEGRPSLRLVVQASELDHLAAGGDAVLETAVPAGHAGVGEVTRCA